jgi:hypothetical protein
MKAISLQVETVAETIDTTALDAAVKIASSKIKPLGLEQLTRCRLEFEIGQTQVVLESQDIDSPEAPTEIEE